MTKKELTNEQREQIIGAYLAGINDLKISFNFNILSSTIYDTINHYKNNGSSHPKKRSGRPETISDRSKHFYKELF